MTSRSTIHPAPGPVRTCVGCRQRAAKTDLLRVTAGSDSDGHPALVPDPTATAPGRGAHLHPTLACLDLAVRRRAFTRALRMTGGQGPSAEPLAAHLATVSSSGSTGTTSDTDQHERRQDWSSSS